MEVTCHPRPGGASASKVRGGGHRNLSDGCYCVSVVIRMNHDGSCGSRSGLSSSCG